MALTEKQKQLVTGTFARLIPISDKFAKVFYARLWEIAPETQELFSGTDMSKQRIKLVMTIATAVNAINNLSSIVPTIRDLGKRHLGYGVTKEQYDDVGQALLWALEQELGDEFTADVKEAWAAVYNLLASIATEAYGKEEASL